MKTLGQACGARRSMPGAVRTYDIIYCSELNLHLSIR